MHTAFLDDTKWLNLSFQVQYTTKFSNIFSSFFVLLHPSFPPSPPGHTDQEGRREAARNGDGRSRRRHETRRWMDRVRGGVTAADGLRRHGGGTATGAKEEGHW